MYLRNIYLLILLLVNVSVYCQSAFYANRTRWVSVETVDGESRFEIINEWKSGTKNSKAQYYWYDRGRLSVTQGAYAGNLLHGQFLLYGKKSANLIEKGEMRNGLKIGKWKRWSDNGFIAEIENWKKGLKHGTTTIYSSDLQVISKSNYRKGMLHGWQYQYENGLKVNKQKYKNDKIDENRFLGIKRVKSYFLNLKKSEVQQKKKPGNKKNKTGKSEDSNPIIRDDIK